MKKILVLPTWLIFLMIKPFLKDNNFLKREISLADWCEHSTKLNIDFAIIFWCIIIFLVYIIIR